MMNMKNLSKIYGLKSFTDSGDYFGDVEECTMTTTKVIGWRIKATRGSFLEKILGSAKGVIVPHNLVKSIGDIMIISKGAIPAQGAEPELLE